MNLDAEAQILLKQIERFVSAKGRQTTLNRLRAAIGEIYLKGHKDGVAYVKSLPAPMRVTAHYGPVWQVKFMEREDGRSKAQG